MNCYNFKQMHLNNNNLLNNSVDATYVIHLENNGRLNSIIEQLQFFQPTKQVFILFNKGFKKCKKDSHIISSNTDLVDAYFKIFEHSNENYFNNILILEDDFIFNKQIKNKVICDDINNFILNNNEEEFIYYLGCLPFFQNKYSGNHNIVLISGGTHAVIYSKKLIDNTILKMDKKIIVDWDLETKFFKKYMYNKPLCYQLFPETENYNNWYSPLKFDVYTVKFLMKQNKLDENVEPGYSNFYYWSEILTYFLYILLLFIIFIILKKIYLRKINE